MKIIKSQKEIIKYCNNLKTTTSFVPTMGSLHKGHESLLKEARKKCDFLISSLFINPLQFNNPDDLFNYPKNLQLDIEIFEKNYVDLLYIPEQKEIINSDLKKIDSGPGGKILEGEFRPGHFDGVLTIVNKFFELIKPDYAYFGIKDLQQLCLIFTKLSHLHKTKIVPVETVRDSTGLALSSRNTLLNNNEKKIASKIFEGLNSLDQLLKKNDSINIETFLKDFYRKQELLKVEYILIKKLSIFNENSINISDLFGGIDYTAVMVAAKVGEVRLIDNLLIK